MPQPTDTEWPSEPRTLLKHQIYKRYVDCWMGKILQVFPIATIVDAFAGPGAYSDGPDGSSIVIAKANLNHTGRARFKTLRLVWNETRADRNAALTGRLAGLTADARLLTSVVVPPSDFQDAVAGRADCTRFGMTGRPPFGRSERGRSGRQNEQRRPPRGPAQVVARIGGNWSIAGELGDRLLCAGVVDEGLAGGRGGDQCGDGGVVEGPGQPVGTSPTSTRSSQATRGRAE